MKRTAILALGAVVLGGIAWFVHARFNTGDTEGLLFGNVEIRQVDLAFNSEGTVTEMLKREGDGVHAGEAIAKLDEATWQSATRLAEARRDAAQAGLTRLLNGSRPEDILQARANVAAARAMVANSDVTMRRQQALGLTQATPQQAVDDARRVLDTANAQRALSEAALAEAVNGPRAEDIDIARAQLREAEATLSLAQTNLAHTVLHAPSEGVVMTRVIEPGTVVMPTSVVYSVAITGEVWVRAFVPETMLGRVAPDAHVRLFTDARPDRAYDGRIGYVSPTAEFTPKTVETPELRTQLVYRVRIRITDPDSLIRQGQPVTIALAPVAAAPP